MSYLSIKTTSSIENMSNKNNIKSRNFKFFSRQMFDNYRKKLIDRKYV